MNNSEIVQNETGKMYVGPDAVSLMRAKVLASSLTLFAKTGLRPTRGVTGTMMLRFATEITGKPYKRSQHELAAEDVRTWCRTMACAIPTTVNGVQL